jgi:hypothetical protein
MKKLYLLSVMMMLCVTLAAQNLSVIPIPAHAAAGEGVFVPDESTRILYLNPELQYLADYAAQLWQPYSDQLMKTEPAGGTDDERKDHPST